jgi:hypothetical protein
VVLLWCNRELQQGGNGREGGQGEQTHTKPRSCRALNRVATATRVLNARVERAGFLFAGAKAVLCWSPPLTHSQLGVGVRRLFFSTQTNQITK